MERTTLNSSANSNQESTDSKTMDHPCELIYVIDTHTSLDSGKAAALMKMYSEAADSAESNLDSPRSQLDSCACSLKRLQRRFQGPEKGWKSDVGISFRNLNVYGFGVESVYQKTFSNYPLAYFSAFRDLLSKKPKTGVQILEEFEGLIKGGEMLVVLGRPGSGCSTLLKTLSGQTHGFHVDDKSTVNYQGVPLNIMQSDFRGECIYQSESDVHFPHLSVGQTLNFAAEARAPWISQAKVSRRVYAAHVRDAVVDALNLSHTLDTKIGNDFVPGVSGGERKRASLAEVMVSGGRVQCWDNSTRGLDSANALGFVRALRSIASTTGSVNILSLYQASQSIYDLFDKVSLLYQGRQIFFGSVHTAKKYFTDLGFICPDRANTADFLTSLTKPAERVVREGYEDRVPRSPEDFARIWKSSTERANLQREIIDYENKMPPWQKAIEELRSSVKQEKPIRQHPQSPYRISVPEQIRLCIRRGFQRLRGDLLPPVSGIVGNCIMSIIVGSMFYNMPEDTSSFFGREVLLFFTILLNTVLGAFEGVVLWDQRPIVEKHYHYAFYHPFAEAMSSMICDLPNKVLLTFFFNIPFYFLANLRRTTEAFFIFYLFAFASLLTGSMIFRAIGALSRTLSESLAPGAIFIMLLTIYSGFVIPARDMHPWLRWFAYVDPTAYAYESLMINEFSNRTFPCVNLIPSGPGYSSNSPTERICAIAGAQEGVKFVDGNAYIAAEFQFEPDHLWRNLVIILAMMISVCGLYLIATEFVSLRKSKGDVLIFRRGQISHSRRAMDEEGQCSLEGVMSQTEVGKEDTTPLHVNTCAANFLWDDLSYDLKLKNGSRRILDHIEGWIKPGTLTALMGASGAGKTTLLNVLANRVGTGVIYGEKLVDRRYQNDGFARKIGYAQQHDLHLPSTTVRKALQFSALLRQSQDYSQAEKLAYVEEVIETLDMEHYADAIIGVPGEGLNIEQRKCVTIGVELAARPELLLFLDEPTSGLDSDTAWSVCTLLRRLADKGQAILCTIHQPSGTLFQMFDKLLFLSDGKSLYFGDIGYESRTLTGYFEQRGARRCEVNDNPAEWLFSITSDVADSTDMIDWAGEWERSQQRRDIKDHIGEMKSVLFRPAGSAGSSGISKEFAEPFWRQLYIVTQRSFAHQWRTPSYLWSKVFTTLGLALFNGFSFWQSKPSIQGIQNQLFSVFILMTMFQNIVQLIMPQFLENRALYEIRERPSRTYSWYVFVLSNIIVEIPSQSLMAVLVLASWYFPLGMYRNAMAVHELSSRGILTFLILWSYMMFTSTFSQMVATTMPDAATGINVASLLFMLSLLFSGVLVSPDALPRFWIFMYRVSPISYFVSALMSTGIAGVPVICAASELSIFDPPAGQTCASYLMEYIQRSGGTLLNPPALNQCQFCPVTSTDDVLGVLGIQFADRWRDFGISLVYSVVNVIGALVLYWIARVPKGAKRQRV